MRQTGIPQSPVSRLFMGLVAASGILLVSISGYGVLFEAIGHQWLILAALTVLTGAFAVKIPGVDSKVSVADTFIFTNLLLFGTYAGTLTAALDAITSGFQSRTASRRFEFVFFNLGAMSVSVFVTAKVFFWLLGRGPLIDSPEPSLRELAFPVVVMAFSHYVINSGIVTGILALERRENLFRIWRGSFVWTALTYFTAASVAALVALNARAITPTVVILVLPSLVITYFSYRTYLEKVISQVRHLEELNQLYMRTVESLALAVDAKDQTTHGHIRRVRTYAVGLARLCEIDDPRDLMAIETGSLLHDIGKLAIDDYILNKPGRLTREEFERMKTHAAAGDEILQQIQFPFPVAEYVRAHHERWDGNGYPDGLRGEGIPLGSRILAIADSYDAIRSTRPYKISYGTHDAVAMLKADAGRILDPRLVELFVQNIDSLEKSALEASSNMPELSFRKDLLRILPPERDGNLIPAGGILAEMLSLREFCRSVAGQLTLEDLLLNIEARIRRMIPCDTCAIYLETEFDQIEAVHVGGRHAEALRGLRIPLGRGISGWVAAYQRAILKTGPALEFHNLPGGFNNLSDALVVPLSLAGDCIGTLSLYAGPPDCFTEEQQALLLSIALEVAPLVESARRSSEVGAKEDGSAARLPRLSSLAVVGHDLLEALRTGQTSLCVMYADIESMSESESVRDSGDEREAVAKAAAAIWADIQDGGFVFGYGPRGFLVLIPDVSPEDAEDCVSSMRQRLNSWIEGGAAEARSSFCFRLGWAMLPGDAVDLGGLIDRAYHNAFCDPPGPGMGGQPWPTNRGEEPLNETPVAFRG